MNETDKITTYGISIKKIYKDYFVIVRLLYKLHSLDRNILKLFGMIVVLTVFVVYQLFYENSSMGLTTRQFDLVNYN